MSPDAKKIADLLRKARALIEKRETWTVRAMAINYTGRLCGTFDTDACAWCLAGAIVKAAGPKPNEKILLSAEVALQREAVRQGAQGFIQFNDSSFTSHPDVIALLDRAIARLEAQ